MTFLAVTGFGSEPIDTAAAVKKARIDSYVTRIESELRQNILTFWLAYARDGQRGGFHGQLNDGSRIPKDAPRGALLTARILWTFSAAYRRYHDPAYLQMARWAYDDLLAHFWDKEHGGLYWKVSADGVPLDPRKIIYVQAFGIYGLAEFHLATGEQQPLDRAIELYRTMEQHAHDRTNLGYFEEFSRDWKKSPDRGEQSAMGSLGQKSQNVHLHVLEAYTNLVRAWPDTELKKNLSEVADLLLMRVLDSSNHHLRLFMEEDWSPQSDSISYGHDIEFSWLIVESAEVLGDAALIERARHDAVKIAAATLKEGVDADGGVFEEGGPGGVTKTYKEWWTQAEATVGFINAYQLSGTPAFLEASLKSWEFIDQRLIDRKKGEWFIGVSKEGRVTAPVKISFWKCPYHNGRACMEMIDRLRAISRKP